MKVLLVKVLIVEDNNGSTIKERPFSKIVELTYEPSKGMAIYLGNKQQFYVHHIVQNMPRKRLEAYHHTYISRYKSDQHFDNEGEKLIKEGWELKK